MTALHFERDYPLAPLTSWQVGGPADFFLQPKTVDELRAALKWVADNQQPLTVLGGGTNVLVSDRGVRGAVIALGKMSGIEVEERDGRLRLSCLAGTPKSEVLKSFLKYRLEPALFMAGLPGDVGGGVAMNAGVGEMIRPREFVEIVEWIEVVRPSGELVRLAVADLHWAYRHCEGWKPGVIARVGLGWPLVPSDDILVRVRQANQSRLSKQPLELPSCGSVFVNPEGHKSGKLIQDCGLKGFVIGGARVSPKHANFIVNIGGAKAADIHAVIEHVKKTVLAQTGVQLKTEVVYLGEW